MRPRSISRIRFAILRRKARSWVTNKSDPRHLARKVSSHCMDSMSKWLVGSSRQSKSGSETMACASKTRRFQPEDNSLQFASKSSCIREDNCSTLWFCSHSGNGLPARPLSTVSSTVPCISYGTSCGNQATVLSGWTII